MLCLHWVGQAARGQRGCSQHCPGSGTWRAPGHAAAGLGVKQQCVLLIPTAPSPCLWVSAGLAWLGRLPLGLGCGLVEEIAEVNCHSQEQTVTTQSHPLD